MDVHVFLEASLFWIMSLDVIKYFIRGIKSLPFAYDGIGYMMQRGEEGRSVAYHPDTAL